MRATPSHRRSPPRAARDPARTRERILSAALHEFSANGFAGARVDVVARRAAVNKRMLYHYFKSKKGLFRAVLQRKISDRAGWADNAPENPMELAAHWFNLGRNDTDWIRLLEWEALQMSGQELVEEESRRKAYARAVARIRDAQAAGWLAKELDPAHALLSIIALWAFPQAFPQMARLATGLEPDSEQFHNDRLKFLRQFAALFHPPKKRTAK